MAGRARRGLSHEAISVAASVGLVALCAATLGDISDPVRAVFLGVLVLVWGVFVVDLVMRAARGDVDRAAWLRSFAGLGDIAAVLVPPIGVILGLAPADAALLCAVWVAKFARESTALRLIGRVVASAGGNLLSVTAVFALVMFLAALFAHLFERSAQPDSFGSIPAALWWAVATLSTTGYGDVTPVTFAGRILAGVVMTAGIATFALWAGILVTGFADELRRQEFLRNWDMVARVPLFAGLDARSLAEIVRVLRARRVQAGSVVCRKGDPGEQMYFIADGEVEVATDPPVRLDAGGFFGELALLTGDPRAVTVSAVVPTSLLVLDISDFRVLCAQNTAMAEAINAEAERRLRFLKGPQASLQ